MLARFCSYSIHTGFGGVPFAGFGGVPFAASLWRREVCTKVYAREMFSIVVVTRLFVRIYSSGGAFLPRGSFSDSRIVSKLLLVVLVLLALVDPVSDPYCI